MNKLFICILLSVCLVSCTTYSDLKYLEDGFYSTIIIRDNPSTLIIINPAGTNRQVFKYLEIRKSTEVFSKEVLVNIVTKEIPINIPLVFEMKDKKIISLEFIKEKKY